MLMALHEETRQMLKQKLEQAELDVSKALEKLTAREGVVDFGSDIDHFDEEADEAEEMGNQLGMARAFRDQIEDIRHALGKFAEGTYGICEQCGSAIDENVLTAAPESRLCRSCKTKTRAT